MVKDVQMAKEGFVLVLARGVTLHRHLPRCAGKTLWDLASSRYGRSLNTERQDVAPAETPALGGLSESYIEHSNQQGPAKLWVQGAIPTPHPDTLKSTQLLYPPQLLEGKLYRE